MALPIELFRREGLIHRMNSSLFQMELNCTLDCMLKFLTTQWTFTTASERSVQGFNFMISQDFDSGLRCQVAGGEGYMHYDLYTISTGEGTGVRMTLQELWEGGIYSMYKKYCSYVQGLPRFRMLEIFQYNQETAENPFEMNNWKIISIFIAWAACLVFAMLVFVFEVFKHGFESRNIS